MKRGVERWKKYAVSTQKKQDMLGMPCSTEFCRKDLVNDYSPEDQAMRNSGYSVSPPQANSVCPVM
jgi:hypothetical protein